MRTAISTLDVSRPATLSQALTALREEPRTPLAGATDLYVALNFGTLTSSRFLDLWRLDELRLIAWEDGTLTLGALVTYTALVRSPTVQQHLPMLVEAARQLGGLQIQNRGTIGGNIANASPAGDTLPVLAAADAVVILRSVDGVRRIPITSFYTGYRRSVMRPDELIVAIEIPRVEGRQYFRKVGTRAAQAISKVVMAGVKGASGTPPRIAFGSVAPTVMRLPETERALGSGAPVQDAITILEREITPIDDLRSSARYRRTVAGNLLRHFWTA
ncbi:MAG: FAD binding domain-containing protein [Gemmatimonadales bacterium]